MRRRDFVFLAVTASIASGAIVTTVFSQTPRPRYLPEYTASGDLILPKDFHEWVYVGSPLTPNALTTPPSDERKAETVVDANGNLHVPAGYRTNYQFLGSWAVAADQGQGSKELHVVYASPGAIAAYLKNGRFPDGVVLVKEVFQADTGQMTTGTVSRAVTLKGWFVMLRDSKGRHAGNKLWGDGWGWSWFDASNPSKTMSTDYKTDCRTCHVPAQASDFRAFRLPRRRAPDQEAPWGGLPGLPHGRKSRVFFRPVYTSAMSRARRTAVRECLE